MYKRAIAVLLAFSIFPFPVLAGEKHWAEQDFVMIYQLDGIAVEEADRPASRILQEKVYGLLDLHIFPRKGIKRYWLLKAMVDYLGIEDLEEKEISILLEEYSDFCSYCIKANQVLAKAKKCGLLGGRITQEGLVTAAKDPVTNAELVVFSLRYLKIKSMINLPKNGIICTGVDEYE